jgi:uncharacterized RDD family membrane protein YckC
MSTSTPQNTPVIVEGRDRQLITRGVMSSRIIAWLVDALLVTIIAAFIWLICAMLGVITFGATWFFLPVVAVGTVMGYAAINISGTTQATPGMRMAGLMVTDHEGNRPQALNAAVHALLFYVVAPVFPLWLAMIGIGFLRSDSRMGHDLIAGLKVGRRV